MGFVTVEQAARILKRGGVVAVPTETVYGLAADATNRRAIKKIYTVKKRPQDNPLICHFYSYESAEKYVADVPSYVNVLAEKFLPGPLSLLLNLRANSPLLPATAGRNNVIIRIPDHTVFKKLLKELDFPLAAPSANTSGKYSSTNAEMVEQDLGNKIDGVIDGGQCKVGIESTIIDCRKKSEIRILRQGAVGADEIRRAVKRFAVTVKEKGSSKETTPGSRYKHYAPRTPVYEINTPDEIKETKSPFSVLVLKEQLPAVRLWMKEHYPSSAKNIIVLGSVKNEKQIAKNLYKCFHRLDGMKTSAAYLLKTDFGKSSVGKAIAERLKKVVLHL